MLPFSRRKGVKMNICIFTYLSKKKLREDKVETEETGYLQGRG